MTISDIRLPPWLLVWGKTDKSGVNERSGGPLWNPLIAHALDTAACAGQLWDRYLPVTARERLAQDLAAGDEDRARRVLMLLAAVHDLGKGCDCFLHQFGTDSRDRESLTKGREAWERQARLAGVPLSKRPEAQPYARHEHVTAAHLPRLLGCTCYDCGGSGPREEALHTAASLLGGHHGHIPNADTVGRAVIAAPFDRWEPIYRGTIDTAADMIGVDISALRDMTLERPAALVLLAGAVVLSDWIASSEKYFRYRHLGDPVHTWWHAAQHEAAEAMTALLLDAWKPLPATWEQLWPGTRPRSFQSAAMAALTQLEGSALVVVESDTGSGKTRLALWCAHHLARTCGYQGLYVAMPTRAATNQIATELRTFIATALGEQESANLAVVHGAAEGSPLVHQLLDAAEHPGARALSELADSADSTLVSDSRTGRAVLEPWYFQHCLGLIATFGVGTVDQITLATQRSEHWFFRMFGLAVKTVIIDEAHAYELYQQDLLSAAIEWLADSGASVVVLSATLPADARQALTDAWCRGHRTRPDDCGQTGPITVVDRRGIVRRTGPSELPAELHTHLDLLPDPGTAALADQLLSEAAAGGVVAVVRNRVASANELYAAARAAAPGHGWAPDEVLLLHGRQLPRERLPIEERLTQLLGPNVDGRSEPNPQRPTRLLVVATQVIEQSLDIDFDRVYTDLAPGDLLVQRGGRLHRHSVNDTGRPAVFKQPRMTVLWRPDGDNLPLVEPVVPGEDIAGGNGDGAVYAPYILAATWLALTRRTEPDGSIHLVTPRDSASLLRDVYGPEVTAPGRLGDLLARTWKAWRFTLNNEHSQAVANALTPYEGDCFTPVDVETLASGTAQGEGSEDTITGLEGLRAKSRLGDLSVNVVVLYKQHSGPYTYTYDRAGKHGADLRGYSPTQTEERRNQMRDLMLNTLPLPARWFAGEHHLPKPSEWRTLRQEAVRRSLVAIFDARTGNCIDGPIGTTYLPVYGLTRQPPSGTAS